MPNIRGRYGISFKHVALLSKKLGLDLFQHTGVWPVIVSHHQLMFFRQQFKANYNQRVSRLTVFCYYGIRVWAAIGVDMVNSTLNTINQFNSTCKTRVLFAHRRCRLWGKCEMFAHVRSREQLDLSDEKKEKWERASLNHEKQHKHVTNRWPL